MKPRTQQILNAGDFNNDLTISETSGDTWSYQFKGMIVQVVAPKEAEAGKIGIKINGQTHEIADPSGTGMRQAQQVVCEVTGLTEGNHLIKIINRGPGKVAIDALVIR